MSGRWCIVYGNCRFDFNHPDVSPSWSGLTRISSCQMSRRWCIVYGNCRFDFNHPDVSPSWSGLTRISYGNCVLKFSRLDSSAPWSGRAKLVMEITCSGRASVRTIEPSRPVAQLSVRTAPRQILPDAHSDPQPINRGPWALRATRIRCEFH
jgi:hypothetical protein